MRREYRAKLGDIEISSQFLQYFRFKPETCLLRRYAVCLVLDKSFPFEPSVDCTVPKPRQTRQRSREIGSYIRVGPSIFKSFRTQEAKAKQLVTVEGC